MDILGLDKIRKISDNTDLEPSVIGLEMIHCEEDSIRITGLDSIRTVIESDFPRMSSFALEVIRLAGRARELDKHLRQFGAEEHQYLFEPVIPLSQVRDFEGRHRICLPQGYVDFLTQVGNGGAGPDYGIFSLEQAEFSAYHHHKNTHCLHTEVKGQPDYATLPYSLQNRQPLVDAMLTPERWNAWYAEMNRYENQGDRQQADARYCEAYNGLLQIIDSGSGEGYMLVCTGSLQGEVVVFRQGMECPSPTGRTFEEFVLTHFKGVIDKFEKNQ